MRAIIVCTLTLLMLSVACRQDADLHLPYEGDRIVVNTFIQADSPVYIRVTRSEPVAVLDDLQFDELPDAQVALLENGAPFAPLHWQQINGRGYFVSELPARPGQRYTVTATATGLTPVSGSDSLPAEPVVHSLSALRTANSIRFILEDPAAATNYYRIRLYKADSVDGVIQPYQKIDFRLDPAYNNNFADIVSDSYYKDVVIHDERIAGKEVLLVLQTQQQVNYDYVVAEVAGLSESGYRYLQSLNNQVENGQDSTNILGQPIKVYTNIENGYGIVAGLHARRIHCRVR
ncbi:DUF4249 domain-containing protein [Chitinophaga japonensis]|uniref:Uncharacterized protein DUF4249 n=1 Tax=Chitinophaga japonensis TaxID=104662 RepID=A0A562TC20_CHIJA|nr:DUF4249 domain-containing protein [Chitinophaga japonensis]TWI91059.1 uncharacterized protein DUF4249 [Chitinophaga japonensis]